MPEPDDARAAEQDRLTGFSRGLSTWQRFVPFDVRGDEVLSAIEDYLDLPETHRLYDEHEETEAYPTPVIDRLGELGLAEIFSTDGEVLRATAYHMCSLNEIAARRDTSVAVTLSVNVLGLLPAYLAATEEQLARIDRRIRDRNFAALLLSELRHGSNLLRNQARAERGRLDDQGSFIPVGEEEDCTHYRLNGDKHLINGATRHGLLFVCLRTKNTEAYDELSTIHEPMKARGDFTLFWLDRGPGMTPLPRWHTLPARAADISGLRFENCLVEADRVIGREHGGMGVAHKTLMLSRGGVSSLAAGCIARARDLTRAYARRRNVYGQAIVHLGAVTDHLMKLEALDLLVASIGLKATALLNSLGLAASHYTCVAKIMACALAEEGVGHGQKVLGARALVRELPYERLIRDVNLFGVFDGTSHVMLEELSSRLAMAAKSHGRSDPNPEPSLDRVREYYSAPPNALKETLRRFHRGIVFPMVPYLTELDALPGELRLSPLADAAGALFDLVRALQELEQWKPDQGARLSAAELFAQLEVLIACVEFCDPDRRPALGLPTPREPDEMQDRVKYTFAMKWLGSRIVAGIRQLVLRSDLPDARRTGPLQTLAEAEEQLLRGHDRLRTTFAEILRADV